ncbi:glutathione S-transferase [Amphritea opalescens]|uniref:Glutathione S-transferase n=1 Tax=Amphritea opalescens TaxID=2490544 RepID=A0A430KM34_9GAMM|nr:glutathione binding-like protein [Amphritea opalescens]RTE64538.1 glutathione S-transferase [Amphritea opalescens]
MIELYTAATPNGHKISIALEEMQLPYLITTLDLTNNEQKSSHFLTINPNGKIPAIIDRGNHNISVFDSGAILIYLAEKSGKLLSQEPNERSQTLQWLMFQMSGIGPMMGQANVWYRYREDQYQPAIDRYQNEVRRLYAVMNNHLNGRDYLAQHYSIADIANWAWIRTHEWSGVEVDEFPHLQDWIERIAQRPACQRGINLPPINIHNGNAERFIQTARSILVN